MYQKSCFNADQISPPVFESCGKRTVRHDRAIGYHHGQRQGHHHVCKSDYNHGQQGGQWNSSLGFHGFLSGSSYTIEADQLPTLAAPLTTPENPKGMNAFEALH
uniref:Uncharacterized protein n=1 Tax=Romanomermis culicivorax TaxID=13658 RepID=A0A915HQV1_ROMCU